MLTLNEIASQLADRRPAVVAEATGLHVNTITTIRDGKNQNPTEESLNALRKYLEPEKTDSAD